MRGMKPIKWRLNTVCTHYMIPSMTEESANAIINWKVSLAFTTGEWIPKYPILDPHQESKSNSHRVYSKSTCHRRVVWGGWKITSIFIIDDDENLHRVYRSFFSMKGFTVIASAFDGAEAVIMFNTLNPRPDILLMDYRMPIQDGVSATREITRIDPNTKIIFLSADETARDQALEAGAISFLVKPVRFSHLLRTIDDILKNH